jgi:hypothetical protein
LERIGRLIQRDKPMAAKKYRAHPLPRDRRPADFSQSRPQRTYRRHTRVDFSLLTLHRGLPFAKGSRQSSARLSRSPRLAVAIASRRATRPIQNHMLSMLNPVSVCPGISTRRSRRQRTAALHFLRTGLLARFQNTRTQPQSAPRSQEYEMNADLIPGWDVSASSELADSETNGCNLGGDGGPKRTTAGVQCCSRRKSVRQRAKPCNSVRQVRKNVLNFC